MKTIHPAILAAGLSSLVLVSCAKQTPTSTLALELPQELAIGSPKEPKDLRKMVPHLDINLKPSPIQVPVGASVVSRGAKVTSSDKEEPFEGSLAMITDGEKDGNEGYSVILGKGPQWVQIDLGEPKLVDAVVLWHYFRNNRVVDGVVVQASEDVEFKNTVTTLFNDDVAGHCGQGNGKDSAFIGTYLGKQIPGQGTKARYIRCWSNGNSDNKYNEYIEVEVWGRPIR